MGTGSGEVTTLSSSVVHSTDRMVVREDWVRHPDGTPGLYGVVETHDLVVVVPVRDGGLFLVEQYRYPARGRYWELPRVDAPAGDPAVAPADVATGELRTAGLQAGSLERIGSLHEAYGFATQKVTVVLATGLAQSAPGTSEPSAGARWFSLEEMWALVDDGRLTDAVTLAAVALTLRRGALASG